MKQCCYCREVLPADAFGPCSSKRDGLQAGCRECRRGVSSAVLMASPNLGWESSYRRRVRAFGFEPVVESFTRAELVALYGDRCFHCGGDFEELDHFPVPVRAGGTHTLENVRPSCAGCNRSGRPSDAADARFLDVLRALGPLPVFEAGKMAHSVFSTEGLTRGA